MSVSAEEIYAVFRLMSNEDQGCLMAVMRDRANANIAKRPKLRLAHSNDAPRATVALANIVRSGKN